ncbi:hypothetical protein ACTHUE_17820, partial [Neisseria sp. P0021.S005]|uniref:hypothetical protein n=1 Tax=Neisseria sp. P0021.S005 TaxID=3436820 RepID=UPI003F7EC694
WNQQNVVESIGFFYNTHDARSFSLCKMHGIISHRLDANIGNTRFNVIFLHDLIWRTKICQRIAVSSKISRMRTSFT